MPEDKPSEEGKARRPKLWAYVLGGLASLIIPVVGLPVAVTLIAYGVYKWVKAR